ncbi:tetratricopeptide repeat protein [Lunatimonas salinarum]|uniref:tetratricopeptide repeat protein n=1 Tax=Lunatimonas salinarum TaxID=1774590 RepID=UPI001AE0B9CB|nr:tetratricopeptide repeat protein [Lunatimonas salinarum]
MIYIKLLLYIFLIAVSGLAHAANDDTVSQDSLMVKRYFAFLDSSRTFQNKDLKKSLYFVDQARGYADSLEKPGLLVKVFNQYGRVYFTAGLAELSSEYYVKSYEILNEAVDLPQIDQISTLLGIGINYLFLENYDSAEEYFIQVEEMLKELPEPDYPTLSAIINNLGIIYREKGDLVRAYSFLEAGIKEIGTLDPENKNLGYLYNNLGLVYLQMKNYEAALEAFGVAEEIAFKSNNSPDLATSYSYMAETYQKMGNIPLAIRYGRECNQLAAVGEILAVQHNCSDLLANLYKESGRLDSALFFLEEKEQLFKQINQSKAEKNLLTQSLDEMHALEKEALVEESEKSYKSLFLFLLLSLLILGILLFLYFNIRKRYQRVSLEKMQLTLVSKQKEQEKQLLEAKLQEKSKQLTTKLLYETKRLRIVKDTVDKLVGNRNEFSKQGKAIVSSVVGELSQLDQDNILAEFETSFLDLHTDFYNNLLNSFPDLTPNERRLCALIRLNLNSREISALTGQSKTTLNMAKTRLRRKLNITHSDQDLYDFLSRF